MIWVYCWLGEKLCLNCRNADLMTFGTRQRGIGSGLSRERASAGWDKEERRRIVAPPENSRAQRLGIGGLKVL